MLVRALEKPIQAGAPNPQHLRGPDSITVARFEHALNVNPPHFLERLRTPVSVRCTRAPLWPLQMRRQIAHVDKISRRRDMWWYRGEAKVGGALIAEAEIGAYLSEE